MKQPAFEQAIGRPVSRETFARLEGFAALAVKWQRQINLVAPSTIATLWERHLIDSAHLADFAKDPMEWIDIGAGGGFPGLVLAVLALDQAKPCRFQLVESNGKKAAFLREAARLFAPNALVHDQRAEVFLQPPRKADIISARALAPLVDLAAWAEPLLISGSLGLFMKGQEVHSELAAAKARFPFQIAVRPHGTEAGGSVVAMWQGGDIHPLMSRPNAWTLQR